MRLNSFINFLLSTLENGGSSGSSNSSCDINPITENCIDYQLDPKIVNDSINDLCKQMPFMPGCTIKNICNNNSTNIKTQPYCNEFSILGDICSTDMPNMNSCKSYTNLCNKKDSKVKQCTDYPPIKNLPSTIRTQKLISNICTEMYMSDCDKCAGNKASSCDLIDVYSRLCYSMPNMNQCGDWKNMCNAQGSDKDSFPLCMMSDLDMDSPVQMKMYFHTGFVDYILFEGWVPRTTGQYVGSIIAILFMGIFYEFLLTLRSHLESLWSDQNNSKFYDYSTNQFKIDIFRAILQFFESLLAYSLMLVTMTFNIGLFFAVISGITLGTLIFSRFRVQGYIKRACGC